VLIASQGGPRRYLERFQDSGTVCLHVVAGVEHAVKAADAGVDGLVVVGGEAGGHPPSGMVSSLVLTRRIAQELPEMPLISSGGFADGHGLAAGLALGASAVQFGTRFIASDEARVHPAYRRMVVDAEVDDTLTVGRQLGVIRVLRNQFAEGMSELESAAAPLEERMTVFRASSLRSAAVDGDVRFGKVEAGQSAGLVGGVLPAAEIVHQIASEYWSAYRELPGEGAPTSDL
jgi:enoyl-[acyl-carrier protein] reductase II